MIRNHWMRRLGQLMAEMSYAKKAEGIATITLPYGEVQELKTATCAHCDRIVYVQAGTDGTNPLSPSIGFKQEPPAVCHICWSLVCADCHRIGICKPLELRLQQIEDRDRFARQVGLE